MALLSRLTWFGLGKEGTQGTAVAPTIFIPAQGVKPEQMYNFVNDDSLANNATLVRGVYQAEADTNFDFDGMLYVEHIGSYLVAMGMADTVTGSSAPYTHTFKVPAAGTQPPSWTATDYDGVDYRYWPGLVGDQFDLTVDAKGAVKYAMKMKGWPSASSASSAPAFPSTAAYLGYETSVTLAGASSARVISAGLSIKRQTESIHTFNNTMAPYQVFAGPFDATYKLKALFENNTDWNQMVNNSQPAAVFTITQPGAGGPVLTITTTKAAFVKAATDRSQKYLQLDIDIQGVYTATDGSELAVTLSNTASSAY